jgi:hypothetical protein
MKGDAPMANATKSRKRPGKVPPTPKAKTTADR